MRAAAEVGLDILISREGVAAVGVAGSGIVRRGPRVGAIVTPAAVEAGRIIDERAVVRAKAEPVLAVEVGGVVVEHCSRRDTGQSKTVPPISVRRVPGDITVFVANVDAIFTIVVERVADQISPQVTHALTGEAIVAIFVERVARQVAGQAAEDIETIVTIVVERVTRDITGHGRPNKEPGACIVVERVVRQVASQKFC